LFDANEKTNRAARKEEKILIYLSKILGFIIGEWMFYWLSTRTTFDTEPSYGNISTVPFFFYPYLVRIGCVSWICCSNNNWPEQYR
jgi:hypothetical protein